MSIVTLTRESVPGLVAGALSPLSSQGAADDLIRYSQIEHVRFGTGWSVDDSCGQVGTGELALWVARSGSGKSTAYLNIIRNTPEVPTLVVNMEMSPRRQIEWLVSMTWDMEVRARDVEEVLRYGPEDDRYPELTHALGRMGDKYPHLHFLPANRPTVSDLGFVLDDLEAQTGVRPVRIIIDHHSLMGGCEDYNFSGHVKVTSSLHSWAMKEELAVYLLQQTGRNDGQGGRNDGHLPLTMASGMFGGEADADWVFGMYRPDRDPKFKKSKYQFKDIEDYYIMLAERDRVRGITVLQVLKNRPFSDLNEDGIELVYQPESRRLEELGVHRYA